MTEDKRLVAFERLLDIMDRLRAECPWDREQTFESLRNCTIEETYELMDAIEKRDMNEIKKELGDLLLHIVFYSKLGQEQNAFDIEQVANGICDKLIYRHPHVFGTVEAEDAAQVRSNWEDLKLTEEKKRKGVFSGVPASLPSMVKAYRIGEKAASSGFDWREPADIWDKVEEELAEVKVEVKAQNKELLAEEMGDLLFALVNASRLYGIDPELALERANKKFITRFNFVESAVSKSAKTMKQSSPEELDAFWKEAKKEEK